MTKHIRIGSRGSDLALWQAHFFQDQLSAIGVESEIIIITTKGDRIQNLSFDKIEGKGFFTKEIEEKLLADEIDVAIHSHKDLETQMPPGLKIAGVSYREDPSELLLIRKECVDLGQPLHFKENAIIGTSSARRKGQVTSLRPDVQIKDIRGNVPTRVNKLRAGDFDAILLAHAGVHRLQLDLDDLHVEKLDPRLFIPAPAQGVLAYQCRDNDQETAAVIAKLHDAAIAEEIDIERSILSGFGGGCHIPIGAHVERNDSGFNVRVSFAKEWESVNRRVRFVAQNKDEALARFDSLKQEDSLPQRVFISRSVAEDGYFQRACLKHQIQLQDQSLIKTEDVAFEADPSTVEWVFFSSANGVRHFFSQEKPERWKETRFAALGSATSQALANFIEDIDFIGDAGDPLAVAEAFALISGNDSVLFPSSDKSLRTIPNEIPSECRLEVTCYRTITLTASIAEKDCYVFTSPSNVAAFFEAANTITHGSTVVAIGRSTEAALAAHVEQVRVAEIPHEAELFALMAM